MKNTPFVSIIIPVRNEEWNLPVALNSINKLNYPKNRLEIIIVDGYSTDKTVEIAKKYMAKVVYNKKRIRGPGCQIGIRNAKGEFIAFTDADCVVPKNWLKGLLKHFAGENVGSVGGPNVTPKDDTQFAKAAGDAIWFLTRAGARYGLTSQKTIETFHNPGCNVLYRKEAIIKAGGFNPCLITCEDEELDYRIIRQGYKILFTPEISVDHYRRPTFKKIYTQSYRFAIGRAQAIRMYPEMARWFHFGPTALVLSFIFSVILALFYPQYMLIAFMYLFTLIMVFLLSAWYLVLTKKTAPFYIYLVMIVYWLIGWALGFIKGILLVPVKKLNNI